MNEKATSPKATIFGTWTHSLSLALDFSCSFCLTLPFSCLVSLFTRSPLCCARTRSAHQTQSVSVILQISQKHSIYAISRLGEARWGEPHANRIVVVVVVARILNVIIIATITGKWVANHIFSFSGNNIYVFLFRSNRGQFTRKASIYSAWISSDTKPICLPFLVLSFSLCERRALVSDSQNQISLCEIKKRK